MRFKRCLVTGRRDWEDARAILLWLRAVEAKVVIHGGAPGADSLAGWAAGQLGIKTEVYPADWAGLGKKAGPVRNEEMLKMSEPDGCIAFYDGQGKGTRDMMARVVKAGVPLLVIGPNAVPA